MRGRVAAQLAHAGAEVAHREHPVGDDPREPGGASERRPGAAGSGRRRAPRRPHVLGVTTRARAGTSRPHGRRSKRTVTRPSLARSRWSARWRRSRRRTHASPSRPRGTRCRPCADRCDARLDGQRLPDLQRPSLLVLLARRGRPARSRARAPGPRRSRGRAANSSGQERRRHALGMRRTAARTRAPVLGRARRRPGRRPSPGRLVHAAHASRCAPPIPATGLGCA